MFSVVLLSSLAAIFWFLMFSPWVAPPLNFWSLMFIATGVLGGFGLALQRKNLTVLYSFKVRFLAIGLIGAVVLYLIFLVGEILSTRLLEFAKHEITEVYSTRELASPLAIGAILMFWVGPAEEIFWRGLVQQRLAANYGAVVGYVIASALYAAIHIFSLNFMLIMASFICGLFWGALFINYGSVWPGIISHALWDVAIFVVFPIQQT